MDQHKWPYREVSFRRMSNEESRALLDRYLAGDKEAGVAIFTQHALLIRKIAYGQLRKASNMSLEDLCQEGVLGLLKATRKFNPASKATFITYAHYWIRSTIARAIENKDRTVRLPVHVSQNLARIQGARGHHLRLVGTFPSMEELCAATNLSQVHVMNAVVSEFTHENVSKIYARHDAATNYSIPHQLIDGHDKDAAEVHNLQARAEALHTVIDGMENTRTRDILERRFGLNGYEPHTLEEIGTIHDLTRERIRQIERKTLVKLGIRLNPFMTL